MAFKMKGFSYPGKSPLKQDKGKKSQAEKAKEVVARNTSGDDDLKNWNVQDISAVQVDKKGNKFVTEVKDNEAYSGDDENPITTGFKGSKHVDRSLPRDTFIVNQHYPKGHLIDEFEMESGEAQKKKKK